MAKTKVCLSLPPPTGGGRFNDLAFKISKSSTSQGLVHLRELGAIKAVLVPCKRRAHYEAVAELRRRPRQFLKLCVQPALGEGKSRAQRILHAASRLPKKQREHIKRRAEQRHLGTGEAPRVGCCHWF